MITPSDILAQARTYIGVPFVHQARQPPYGLDCLGLVVVTLRDLGLAVEDDFVYGKMPNVYRLRAALEKQLTLTTTVGPGRIGLFWVGHESLTTHLGFLTETGLIHSYMDVGRVVETERGEYWNDRLAATFAIPGVTY